MAVPSAVTVDREFYRCLRTWMWQRPCFQDPRAHGDDLDRFVDTAGFRSEWFAKWYVPGHRDWYLPEPGELLELVLLAEEKQPEDVILDTYLGRGPLAGLVIALVEGFLWTGIRLSSEERGSLLNWCCSFTAQDQALLAEFLDRHTVLKLNATESLELKQILGKAFPTNGDVETLVDRFGSVCQEQEPYRIDDIRKANDTHSLMLAHLVNWATDKDQIYSLIVAARLTNPRNLDLEDFAKRKKVKANPSARRR